MAATKVTTKVIADDAVTIDKINDSALVTEAEGISSNDNDTTVPTSAAVKDYVDTEVAGLVDSAPATLDTLNELAAALGDDANFSTTVTNSIGTKQDAATAVTTTTNFGGDVSGTYNAIVIADDSHNHIIANVDGLQTALDGKVDGTGTAGTLPKLSDSNTITDSAISESGEIIDIDTTGAIRVPDGTTAERPGTPVAGMFRYNTTDGQFEGYTTEWGAIAGTGDGGGGSVDVVTTQHTGDGSTVAFALDSTPGDNDAVQVYLNGVYQIKDAANYSISGSTLTFVDAPVTGTDIEFVHFVLTSGGGGGISWDTTVKTAAFTATAGEGYFVNTTSAAITVTLPSSPSAGDEVSIVDYAGTADTNNITITSSDNINGSSNDVLIDYERGGVSMVYVDATQGWIAYNANNETATALVDSSPIIPLPVTDLLFQLSGADYSTGTTWADQSGNSHNATLYNSPTFNSTGKYFTFDGVNDYARVDDTAYTTTFNNFTCFIVGAILTNNNAFLDFGDNSTERLRVNLSNGNFSVNDGGNTITSTSSSFSTDTDYVLGIRSNGSTVDLKVDDTDQGNATAYGSRNWSKWQIAWRNDNSESFYYNARIYEIIFYTNNLSDSDMTTVYNYLTNKYSL